MPFVELALVASFRRHLRVVGTEVGHEGRPYETTDGHGDTRMRTLQHASGGRSSPIGAAGADTAIASLQFPTSAQKTVLPSDVEASWDHRQPVIRQEVAHFCLLDAYIGVGDIAPAARHPSKAARNHPPVAALKSR